MNGLVRCASGVSLLALSVVSGGEVHAQEAEATAKEIIVTANKVNQRITDVAMSINAASGAELVKLGVTDPTQLDKIVPGFTYAPSFTGTPIFSMRGVGFQDTALAASPTVSVYSDELPIPYPAMTLGAGLDVSRVEVLKGPQGVSFGSNATGGLINYVANKPGREFDAGATLSYGRFNAVDMQGFVSAPLAEGVSARLAARIVRGGAWQKNYNRVTDDWGDKRLSQIRGTLKLDPSDRFTALLSVTGFIDRSDNQMPQLAAITPLNGGTADPRYGVAPFNQFGQTAGYHYPFAPETNRAADWSACANSSVFNEPFNTVPIGTVGGPTTPTNCSLQRNNNHYIGTSLRMEYSLSDSVKLTSLTGYQHFKRDAFYESDGTALQVYESHQYGKVDDFYQELRLSGDFGGKGNWVLGANYEHTKSNDNYVQSFGNSVSRAVSLPGSVLCFAGFDCSGVANLASVPLFYVHRTGPSLFTTNLRNNTYAVYASGEHQLTSKLSVEAGVRYTRTRIKAYGCSADGGDGTTAETITNLRNLSQLLVGAISISQYLQSPQASGIGAPIQAGACVALGAAPLFTSGPLNHTLDEDNVSFKVGVNWKPVPGTLVYANVKQGYKAGSYPTPAASTIRQQLPARQEKLIAYEAGVKSELSPAVQINLAGFYYDYRDKQLNGSLIDALLGPLPQLINIPKSRVYGFEAGAVLRPVSGLRLAPSVAYTNTKVLGCSGSDSTPEGCHNGVYLNYDPFGQLVQLTGQSFPFASRWIVQADGEYNWGLGRNLDAFAGFTVNYRSATRNDFNNQAAYPGANAYPSDIQAIKSYATLDLRAGVEKGSWRFQIWGRNVTNTYYYYTAPKVNDGVLRFAGAPASYGFTLSWKY